MHVIIDNPKTMNPAATFNIKKPIEMNEIPISKISSYIFSFNSFKV